MDIGKAAVQHREEHRVTGCLKLFQLPFVPLLLIRQLPAESQPQRQEIAAQQDVILLLSGSRRPCFLQHDMRIDKLPPVEKRLRLHDLFRAHALTVRHLIIVRHGVIHLVDLTVQLPGFPVEHHQDRGGAERERTVFGDADGRPGHQTARALVQLAHGSDIVVIQETHYEVAITQQVVSLILCQVRLAHRFQQNILDLQHSGDLLPGEQAAHQHQKSLGLRHQFLLRTVVQQGENPFRRDSRQLRSTVQTDDAQRGASVACLIVKTDRPGILPLGFMPLAIAGAAGRLLFGRKPEKLLLHTLLQHMVEPIGLGIGKIPHEGVAGTEVSDTIRHVRLFRNIFRLLEGKFVGEAHLLQQLHITGVQSFHQRVIHHIENIVSSIQQTFPHGDGFQIQIDGREPALALFAEFRKLLFAHGHTAAAAVDGKLCGIQPQVTCRDGVPPLSKMHILAL